MSAPLRLSHRSLETPEVVIPHDPSIPPLSGVKGILLHSSQEGLKALGHWERYSALLGPKLAGLSAHLGSEWVPVAEMGTHYAACDALELSAAELDAMGRWVVDRLQHRLLVGLASSARSAGFDLWMAFAPMLRLTGRLFRGSHASVLRLGPKDVEITIHGNPLLAYKYFRVAYCGTVRGMFGVLGARSSYVKILGMDATRGALTVRASWV